jgi:hypothetical protein
MLQSVEAEVDVNGTVKLLEPLRVTKKTRAIVTLLNEANGSAGSGNSQSLLAFLRENRLPSELKPSAVEIEAQITEARESWD